MNSQVDRMLRYSLSASAVAAALAGQLGASAQDTVFELGKLNDVVTVIGEARDADTTDNKVTIEDVWTFNRNTLDEAIKLVPGVTSTLDGRKSDISFVCSGQPRVEKGTRADEYQVSSTSGSRVNAPV